MKQAFFIHMLFFLSYFIIVSVFKGMLNINYLPFWFGAIIGAFLPDIDYLLQVYVLNPEKQTSKDVNSLISQGKTSESIKLISKTNDSENLLLHTANFQMGFIIMAFWVLTSSTNLLGRGLVLAFLLHLVVDQVSALFESKDYNFWFKGFFMNLKGYEKKLYFALNALVLLVLGLFF
jgi:hypothetical protein